MNARSRAARCAPCLIAHVCCSLEPAISRQSWLRTHSFISRSNLENRFEGLYFHLPPSGAEFMSPRRTTR